MRFDRMPRYEFKDTRRKRMAYARKLLKEQQRYPLFADQIAEQQEDVDLVMAHRAATWDAREVVEREERARSWKKARARLAAYPLEKRCALLAYWQKCKWPGCPTYLHSMMHMYDNGRLDLNPPIIKQTEAQKQTVRDTIKRLHEQAARRRSTVS